MENLTPANPQNLTIIGTAAVAVLIIRQMYLEFKMVQALSPRDLIRHDHMKNAWQSVFSKQAIPESWLLEDNKPKSKISFKKTSAELKKKATELQLRHTTDHAIRGTILNHIAELYEALSQRWVNRELIGRDHLAQIIVRKDGIEVMFFSELAIWVAHAAELDPISEEGIEAYGNILSFCKLVYNQVMLNRTSDRNRDNPTICLYRILALLENYYEKIKDLHHHRSFNTLIENIEQNVLGMAHHGFSILYLLLDPITSKLNPFYYAYASPVFTVDTFVKPQAFDHTIPMLKQTQLGNWLEQTLELAGIESSTYMPAHKLKLQDIAKHLKSDLSAKTSPYSSTGLRPFSMKLDQDQLLNEIRDIHICCLELIHLSQQLVNGARINLNDGEKWTYGHRTGQAALAELIDHIQDVQNNFMSRINIFWEKYYYKFFIPYSEKKIERTDKQYSGLIDIVNCHLPEIEKLQNANLNLCKKIQTHAADYKKIEHEISMIKIAFLSTLLESRLYYKKTRTDNYQIISNGLRSLEHLDTTNEQPEKLKMIDRSVIPRNNQLSLAMTCLEHIDGCHIPDIDFNQYLSPWKITDKRFFSDLQKDVFQRIILNYYSVIHRHWFSGVAFYNADSFAKLQAYYVGIYNAFSAFYKQIPPGISEEAFKQEIEHNQAAINAFDVKLISRLIELSQKSILSTEDRLIAQSYFKFYQAIEVEFDPIAQQFVIKRNMTYKYLPETTVLEINHLSSIPDVEDSNKIIHENFAPLKKAQLSFKEAAQTISFEQVGDSEAIQTISFEQVSDSEAQSERSEMIPEVVKPPKSCCQIWASLFSCGQERSAPSSAAMIRK